MLCSICTINYIAWPSIVDTQRSYKPTSWREWETEMEKRSRVLDCVRGHDVTGYSFFALFLFRMFRFSFSFTFVRFHSAWVLQFFSSTANHLCHPYESMMNYRRPHYYAPVFFSSNKYIVTFLPFQLEQRATNTTQYGSMNGIALHYSRTSQFDDSFFSSHSICAALSLLL